MNPPYGERLMGRDDERPERAREGGGRDRRRGTAREEAPDRRATHVSRLKLQGLYRGLAEATRRFQGWNAVFLSGSPLLEQELHAKPEISHRLWNGPIEVKLLKYHMK